MITRARLYGLTHTDASQICIDKGADIPKDTVRWLEDCGLKVDLSDGMHLQDCQGKSH